MTWHPDDVQRSVRRYLMMLLAEFPSDTGRPWEIRLQRGVVADQDRPIGVLESLPQTAGAGRTSIPQGNVIESMGLVFTGYPPLVAGARAVIEGGLRATRLAGALHDLIRYGLPGVVFATGRRAAGPQHIPLWDYTSIPVAGAAGPAYPHDVLLVSDGWTTRPLQDPVDEARYTVVLSLTVTWERPGATVPPAPVVGSMPSTFEPSP